MENNGGTPGLRHLPADLNEAALALAQEFALLLEDRPPRAISPALQRMATPFLCRLGLLLFLLDAGLIMAAGIPLALFLPPLALLSLLALPLAALAGLALLCIGLRVRRDRLEILRNGSRYDARITGSERTGLRKNRVWYFQLTLSFVDEDGVARSVGELVPEAVAQELAELSRTPEARVDVLYSPAVPDKGLLPLGYLRGLSRR